MLRVVAVDDGGAVGGREEGLVFIPELETVVQDWVPKGGGFKYVETYFEPSGAL